MEPRDRELSRGRTAFVALALAAFCLLAAGLSASRVGQTSDEGNHVNAGRAIIVQGAWNFPFTRAHGPIPFYATQLFLRGEPLGELTPELLTRARYGMLPFAALLLAVVFGWAARAHGRAGGLLALALVALCPMLIGYSALATVDLAHTAFITLVGWGLWEHGRSRRPLPLLVAGLGLGLALGSKYLALLFAPMVGVLAFLGGAGALGVSRSGGEPGPCVAGAAGATASGGRGSVARGLGSLLVVVIAAAVTLHAAYMFRSGFATAPAESYGSELIPALVEHPLTGPLTRVLPQDFLLGAAFQVAFGEGPWVPYLDGRFSEHGFAQFHLRGLLYKTPELILLILLAGLVRSPFRSRGRAAGTEVEQRGERSLFAIALGLIVPPFAYMSLFTNSQVGIRYVLYAYPLLAVLAGGLASEAVWRRWSPRRVGLLAGSAVLLLGVQVLRQWPDLTTFYNGISGGRVRAWHHFRRTNSEWRQLKDTGLGLLAERHGPGLVRLSAADGPRFGKLAIYLPTLVPRDPEDPTRTWHWLHAFEPVDHLRAAWWLYEITPEKFERVARGDHRLSLARATALLGADDVQAAREVLRALGRTERTSHLFELGDAILARAAAPDGSKLALNLAELWLEAGRPDRVESALRPPAAPIDGRSLAVRAKALFIMESFEQLNTLLEGRPELRLRPDLVTILAESYRKTRRHDDAILLYREHLKHALPAFEPAMRKRLAYFERRRARMDSLMRVLR